MIRLDIVQALDATDVDRAVVASRTSSPMLLLVLGSFLLLGGLSVWVPKRQVRRDVQQLDPSKAESLASILLLPAASYRDAPRLAPPFAGRPVRLRGRVIDGSDTTIRALDARPAVFALRVLQRGRHHAEHDLQREDVFWLEDGDHQACVKLPRSSGLPTNWGVATVPGAARNEPIIYVRSNIFMHADDATFDQWGGAATRMTATQRVWALKRLKVADASYLRVTEQAIAVGDEVSVTGVATWDGEQLVVEGGSGHPLRIANASFEEISHFARSYARASELAMIAGAALVVAWLAAQALGISLS